jgi:hypothetical protein
MSKRNLKFVYCPVLKQALEYSEFIQRASNIAGELAKLRQSGFLDKDPDVDLTKMAGALALFGATIEEIHVPLKEDKAASKWEQLRSLLK